MRLSIHTAWARNACPNNFTSTSRCDIEWIVTSAGYYVTPRAILGQRLQITEGDPIFFRFRWSGYAWTRPTLSASAAAANSWASLMVRKLHAQYSIHLHSLRSWSSCLQPFEQVTKELQVPFSLPFHSCCAVTSHPALALLFRIHQLPQRNYGCGSRDPCMLYAFFSTLSCIPALSPPFSQFLLISCSIYKLER